LKIAGHEYVRTNLASTSPADSAKVTLPSMINAWGSSTTPRGRVDISGWVRAAPPSSSHGRRHRLSRFGPARVSPGSVLTDVTIPGADADTSSTSPLRSATLNSCSRGQLASSSLPIQDVLRPGPNEEWHSSGWPSSRAATVDRRFRYGPADPAVR
jgi:hypothetical protein